MTQNERELKKEEKRLKSTIQYWKDKCNRLQYVEEANKILKAKIKVMQLDNEMI